MRFEFNINKKHFFVILVLLIVTGFGIAQPAPNPGHTISQVAGATPNCLTNPSHPFCQAASAQSWGLQDVAIASGYSAYSVNSGNSNQLGGIASTSYCRSDGTNCPTNNIQSGVIFKQNNVNVQCPGGNAVACSGGGVLMAPGQFVWQGSSYQYFDNGFGSWVSCGFVLCAQP